MEDTMATKKMNIGLAISRNFNVVKLDFLEEPVEYNSEEELKVEIGKRLDLLNNEVEIEFSKIQK